MKTYTAPHSMHIVGKAWQIRHQLRTLAKQYPPQTAVTSLLATKR